MKSIKKKTFSTELAWLLGMVILPFGVTFMEKADFGLSMVVAPAYVLYLKLSQIFPFVTFGMAEYALQIVLLLGMCLILRRWKVTYLFSFLTAVLYGFILDGEMLLMDWLPTGSIGLRSAWFVIGQFLCSLGIALFFSAYFMPEVYELLVKVVTERTGKKLSTVKTVYDCISCTVAIVLSFCFFGFGHFEGVKWGTILCAACNGFLIGSITKLLCRFFKFKDFLPWRGFFEGKALEKQA